MAGILYPYLSDEQSNVEPQQAGLADAARLDENAGLAERAFVLRDETKLRQTVLFDNSFAEFIQRIFSEVDQPLFTMLNRTKRFVIHDATAHLLVRRAALATILFGWCSVMWLSKQAGVLGPREFLTENSLLLLVTVLAAAAINAFLSQLFLNSLKITSANLRASLINYTNGIFVDYNKCLKVLGTFRDQADDEEDEPSAEIKSVITDKAWPAKSAKWVKVTLWHADRLEYAEWYINVIVWQITFWWRGVLNRLAWIVDIVLLAGYLGLAGFTLGPTSGWFGVATAFGFLIVAVFRLVGVNNKDAFSENILSRKAVNWKTQQDLELSRQLSDVVRGDRRKIVREEKKRN